MRHPDCHADDAADCQITHTHYVEQPTVTWTPIYDGDGRMINADPNAFVDLRSCATCGRVWEIVTRGGETTLHDLPPPGVTLPA